MSRGLRFTVAITSLVSLGLLVMRCNHEPESIVETPATVDSATPSLATPSRGIEFPATRRPAGSDPPAAEQCAGRGDPGMFGDEAKGNETKGERRRRIDALSGVLAQSDNTELVLAAALLSRSQTPFDVLERTGRALELGPKHPLVLWQAAALCRREQGGTFCDQSALQDNTRQILGRNGAYWAELAGSRYGRGEIRAALTALQRAAVEPDYDSYWIDHIMLLERAFAASSDADYTQRLYEAIGFVAAMPSESLRLGRACRERARIDAEWLDACADFGDRLVADSGLLMEEVVGYGILAAVHEHTGDTQKLAEARLGLQSVDTLAREMADAWGGIMLYDEQRAAKWVDEFAAGGERAAVRYSLEEGRRLLAEPGYDPCRREAFSGPD